MDTVAFMGLRSPHRRSEVADFFRNGDVLDDLDRPEEAPAVTPPVVSGDVEDQSWRLVRGSYVRRLSRQDQEWERLLGHRFQKFKQVMADWARRNQLAAKRNSTPRPSGNRLSDLGKAMRSERRREALVERKQQAAEKVIKEAAWRRMPELWSIDKFPPSTWLDCDHEESSALELFLVKTELLGWRKIVASSSEKAKAWIESKPETYGAVLECGTRQEWHRKYYQVLHAERNRLREACVS